MSTVRGSGTQSGFPQGPRSHALQSGGRSDAWCALCLQQTLQSPLRTPVIASLSYPDSPESSPRPENFN